MGNYREELSLKEIQNNSFKVLMEIKKICDNQGLRYFLAYGTLIGAVRHKGFIPWDDDIDIWMPRSDYEKFLKYCIEHEDKLMPFRLLHYKTEKKYIYTIARFTDTRYRIKYENAKDYGLGLFVDIYPLDGYNPIDRFLLFRIWFLKKMISTLGSSHTMPSKNPIRRWLKPLWIKIISRQNLLNLLEKNDKLAQKYKFERSNIIGCTCWSDTIRIIDKRKFLEKKELEFNGQMFAVPGNYDEILRKSYGDYMKLPPEKDRVAHHYYKAYKDASID